MYSGGNFFTNQKLHENFFTNQKLHGNHSLMFLYNFPFLVSIDINFAIHVFLLAIISKFFPTLTHKQTNKLFHSLLHKQNHKQNNKVFSYPVT